MNYPSNLDLKSGVSYHYITPFLKYFAPVEFVADQNLSMIIQSMKSECLGKLIKGGNQCENIHTGSMAEGLAVPDFLLLKEGKKVVMRDVDEMIVNENFFTANVPDEFQSTYGQGETFEIEALTDGPENYAFLKATDQFRTACELEGNPLRTKYLYNTSVIHDLAATWDKFGQMSQFVDKEIHGPSVSQIHNTYASPGRDRDQVPAVAFTKWPAVAEEWKQRKRISNWPSKEMISKIVAKGHHMAPVGRLGSKTAYMEWRYSFSVAEKELAQSLSAEQRQVYILLKLLHTFHFDGVKGFPTYCLKTMLFWVTEKIPRKHFTDNNVAKLLSYMLDEMHLILSRRCLPHYFIRTVNLLEKLPLEHVTTLCKIISKIRSNIVKCIIDIDNKILFFGLSHRVKLQKAFAMMLVNPNKVSSNSIRYNCLSQILISYLYVVQELQNLPQQITNLIPIQMNVWSTLCYQILQDMSFCLPSSDIFSSNLVLIIYILCQHANHPEITARILIHMCMFHPRKLLNINEANTTISSDSVCQQLNSALEEVINTHMSKTKDKLELLQNIGAIVKVLPLPRSDTLNNSILYDAVYQKELDKTIDALLSKQTEHSE